jgi:uncharacterized protein (UPF0335 family)
MKNNQLQSIIDRIENLENEKAVIAEGIKEVFLEAKGNGFDVKIIRKIIAERKKTEEERNNERAIMDTYLHALGMLADTPLGQFAMKSATKAPAKSIKETLVMDAGIDPDFD